MRIDKLDDFFFFLKENSYQTRKRFFRGHLSQNHPLLPSIGRVTQAEQDIPFDISGEKRMLNSFIQKAYPYLKIDSTSIELLTIAQHHGLPTRLLDWTYNPLVAFFFAIWKDDYADKDGAVFWGNRADFKYHYHSDNIDPFNVNDLVFYEPKYVTSRITAQSGVFSINPDPNIPIDDSRINKVVLSKDVKSEIGIVLETMGIHFGNLFPGLDGISNYIKWLYTY